MSSLRSSGCGIPYPIRAKNVRQPCAARAAGCHAAAMRASRWEILGAWLRIWTPPRDVEVPPVPRRAVALLGLGVAAAVVVIVVVLVPAFDRSKERVAASDARAQAAA